MEDYNNSNNNTTATPRGSFLYGSSSSSVIAPSSSTNHLPEMSTAFYHHHQQSQQNHPTVKTEGGNSQHNNKFHYPSIIRRVNQQEQQEREENDYSNEAAADEAIKAKIIAHPHYSNLLQAYMDCQKVGAPAEVVAQLAAVRQEFEARQQRDSVVCRQTSKDPELDQFMEAYYDMLVKYREELTRPLQEAMEFMRRIETQLNMLSTGPVRILSSVRNVLLFRTEKSGGAGLHFSKLASPRFLLFISSLEKYEKREGIGSSEEDQDNSGGETELPEIDPRAEDRELKNHLLRKYSGYLSSLKQELSKKKKKGKLPKDARQKLLSWWELHYKWPYPSETEKVALAESTGLDQKQINNWFINQRKRHWKPSEDMQFMVMDGLHPQNAGLYMEGHYMGEGPYRLGP